MSRSTPVSIAAAICGALACTSAHSADGIFSKGPSVFNYNYVEAKFLDFDGADGLAFTGSADIKKNIALNVEYAKLSDGPADLDVLAFGATFYKQSVRYPQADYLLAAGLERFSGNGSSSDTGIYLSAGTRYALNDAMEINGALQLSTTGDTDISVHLAALYEVSPGFSGLVETDIGDGNSFGLGVRFYWR